jgi:branched-chain amino acid transport system substrate-binding protein
MRDERRGGTEVKGFRMRWRVRLLVVGALLLSALLATAVAVSGNARTQKFDGTIKFGAAMSVTGSLAAEAKTAKDGYDFIASRINKRGGIPVGKKHYNVKIVYYDDQSNANQSVQLYEKLINKDKVNFLLGPYSSGVTLATSTVAEKYKIPMVVAHAATPSIYERNYHYLFGTLNVINQYTEPLFKMAKSIKKHRPKTVAIMYENALAPTAFANSATAQAKKYGLNVVYKQSFPQGADFAPIMSAVKAKKPDIVLTGGYTLGMISLVRQAAEQNIQVPMWMFMLGPTVPGFLSSVKRLGEYLLEPIQWAPNFNPGLKDEIFGWNAKQYAKVFRKQMGYIPDYHPPQSSAALEVYYKAIKKAGTLDHKKVRDAIARIHLRSFYGNVCFNRKGEEACKSMGIAQVQGGHPVVVWPAKFAQRKLIYPAPGF